MKDILAVVGFNEFSPSLAKGATHRCVRHQCETFSRELLRRGGSGQVHAVFHGQRFGTCCCGHDRLPVCERLENLESGASPNADWYDDDARRVEMWSRIRNGTEEPRRRPE